jgi:hypothetical protein
MMIIGQWHQAWVWENDAFTTLLLKCYAPDGSTSFPDSSASGLTVTPSGNTHIDAAQSKFEGFSSARFDGNDDDLSLPSTTILAHPADFTIDFWVRFNTSTTNRMLVSGSNFAVIVSGNPGKWQVYNGSQHNSSVFPSTGTWYHVALVRSGSTVTLYVDGTSVVSFTDSSSTNYSLSGARIGRNLSGVDDLDGWIQEFRVSKGIARWTANFIPHHLPYATQPPTT